MLKSWCPRDLLAATSTGRVNQLKRNGFVDVAANQLFLLTSIKMQLISWLIMAIVVACVDLDAYENVMYGIY